MEMISIEKVKRKYKYEKYLNKQVLISSRKLVDVAPNEIGLSGAYIQGVVTEIPKGRRKVFHVKFPTFTWKVASVDDITDGVLQMGSVNGSFTEPSVVETGTTAGEPVAPVSMDDRNVISNIDSTDCNTNEESSGDLLTSDVEDDNGDEVVDCQIQNMTIEDVIPDELEEEDTLDENEIRLQEQGLEAISRLTNPMASGDLASWLDEKKLRTLQWSSAHDGAFTGDATDFYHGAAGISSAAMECLNTPLQAFLLQLPIRFWEHVIKETNLYMEQWKETFPVGTKFDRKYRRIEKWEFCMFLGLCFVRTLQPFTRGLRYHWGADATTAGKFRFSDYLSRDRFDVILRFLHFSNNKDPLAASDGGWKVRPFVDTLNTTAKVCYDMGCHVSFDEATIPNRSKYLPMRVYNPMKPHKWGVKLYMVCCAITAYCHHFELHLRHGSSDSGEVQKSGPAALYRNVVYLAEEESKGRRIIYCDRAYTSVFLFIQLLLMGIYAVGTIMVNRIGYPIAAVLKKTRASNRGDSVACKTESIPGMSAVGWFDTKPVQFLATGIRSDINESVQRREKRGATCHVVKCSNVVKQYQNYMNGVDVFDQMCLGAYSLQMLFVFKKWYKSIGFGFIDMAQVNAWILWRTRHTSKTVSSGEKNPLYMERGDFVQNIAQGFLDEGMRLKNEFAMSAPTPGVSVHLTGVVSGDREKGDTVKHNTHGLKCVKGGVRQVKCVVCGMKTSKACRQCIPGKILGLCKVSRDSSEDTCWRKWHSRDVQTQDLPTLMKSKSSRSALLGTPTKQLTGGMQRRSSKVRYHGGRLIFSHRGKQFR